MQRIYILKSQEEICGIFTSEEDAIKSFEITYSSWEGIDLTRTGEELTLVLSIHGEVRHKVRFNLSEGVLHSKPTHF